MSYPDILTSPRHVRFISNNGHGRRIEHVCFVPEAESNSPVPRWMFGHRLMGRRSPLRVIGCGATC